MVYRFDKDKLTELLKTLYTISKISMSVWDAEYNQLTYYPKPMSPLCAKIKSNPEGKMMCLHSDISACKIAASIKGPYTFTCPAGMVDTVVPIFHNKDIIAYIMFGQIRDKEQIFSNIEDVKNLCKKYNADEKAIDDDYLKMPVVDSDQIEAMSNLIKICTPYFYSSQAIKIEQNELAVKIDDYINQNITSSLSVNDLCNEFRVSANLLYQVSYKYFNTSIRDYIIGKRIDKSIHYLTTTPLPISEISVKVGFSDYNYFIRTFKKRTGYTPLSYRKKFPLNIL